MPILAAPSEQVLVRTLVQALEVLGTQAEASVEALELQVGCTRLMCVSTECALPDDEKASHVYREVCCAYRLQVMAPADSHKQEPADYNMHFLFANMCEVSIKSCHEYILNHAGMRACK